MVEGTVKLNTTALLIRIVLCRKAHNSIPIYFWYTRQKPEKCVSSDSNPILCFGLLDEMEITVRLSVSQGFVFGTTLFFIMVNDLTMHDRTVLFADYSTL